MTLREIHARLAKTLRNNSGRIFDGIRVHEESNDRLAVYQKNSPVWAIALGLGYAGRSITIWCGHKGIPVAVLVIICGLLLAVFVACLVFKGIRICVVELEQRGDVTAVLISGTLPAKLRAKVRETAEALQGESLPTSLTRDPGLPDPHRPD
jgi:hypothetical protein